MNQDDIKPFQTLTASEMRNLRKPKKEKPTRKKIEKSERTKILDAADAAFSIWYRAREADENGLVRCATCGKWMKWKCPYGNTHFGHYHSRGFSKFRFDERNGGIQCKLENSYQGGQQVKMKAYLIERYGAEEIEKIDALIETGKRLSDFELKELAKYYRAEARKLIKIKGLV